MLIDAKIALQKAELNKAKKEQERFKRLMDPFVTAIELAIEEGETFATVTVPGASGMDLAGVFLQLNLKGYSVFTNGHEKWLVKFKKQETTTPVVQNALGEEVVDDEQLDEDEFEREAFSDYDDSDDDIPF